MNHVLDYECLAADDVLLVPKKGVLISRSQAEMHPYIYSAPMDTVTGFELTKEMLAQGQVPVVCRNLPEEELVACLQAYAENPNVFFAVSVDQQWLTQFFNRLLDIGIEHPINLAIDVAHGHSQMALFTSQWLRARSFVGKIMSGSICTPQAALDAVEHGCTHLRVGVGPGAVCTTRLKTGCGFPQLSAVYKIHRQLQIEPMIDRDAVTVIADGGIRQPGDAVKYLAAGADGVMMGSAFSKTIESRGWQFGGYKPVDETEGVISFPRPDPEPTFVKQYRGHASAAFQADHGKTSACPEGVATDTFEWQGATCASVVGEYEWGARSAISYLGLRRLAELGPDTVDMVKVTPSAQLEGQPHGR